MGPVEQTQAAVTGGEGEHPVTRPGEALEPLEQSPRLPRGVPSRSRLDLVGDEAQRPGSPTPAARRALDERPQLVVGSCWVAKREFQQAQGPGDRPVGHEHTQGRAELGAPPRRRGERLTLRRGAPRRALDPRGRRRAVRLRPPPGRGRGTRRRERAPVPTRRRGTRTGSSGQGSSRAECSSPRSMACWRSPSHFASPLARSSVHESISAKLALGQ